MIKVLIPLNKEFYLFYPECKNLYESVQEKICDPNSFDFICRNTYFYLFIDENRLIGAIYYFVDKDGKLFLNGFANKKMHKLNLECLKMSLDWFDTDIYAQAQNRASALCLLRCGFRRYKENVFVFEK